MSKYLPLWPNQASTAAGQVDMLYIYLLLVAGAMTALIFVAITVLAIKYRRVPGREGRFRQRSRGLGPLLRARGRSGIRAEFR